MNGFHSECENDATNDKLPTARQFGLQYPELRKVKVKITLFWDDCCAGENSFQVSFYQWLRKVRGEKFFRRLYTSYEGDRVILDFSFSENGIIVSNDDGGIPWEGNWDDVGYIDSYTGGLKEALQKPSLILRPENFCLLHNPNFCANDCSGYF